MLVTDRQFETFQLDMSENIRKKNKKTRIVRESDYSPASQLFLQGEKNNDR